MTPEDAFLEDIREHPDDDTPRLVFSDWLEDHGDSDRAEFIRTLVQVERLDPNSPEAISARDRAGQLLQTHWDRWTQPLGRLLPDGPLHLNWPKIGYRPVFLKHFPRGFVESVEIDSGRFVAVAEELFRHYPIRVLSLHQAADHILRVSACPQLSWIETLSFADYYRAPLDANGMKTLAGCEHLRRLRSLWLPRNHLGDEGATALAMAVWLPSVRWLILDDNGLSASGLAALARTHREFRPHHLTLNSNPIGEDGVYVLAHSPILREVRYLSLIGCGLGTRSISALVSSPYLGCLEHLNLSSNYLSAAAQSQINEAPWRRQLLSLRM